MALYLGKERMAVTLPVEIPADPGYKVATGIAHSDEDGTVWFPELDFAPKLIALWKVREIDLRDKAEEEGEEWYEDNEILYAHDGFMVFAVYQDGHWISQIIQSDSGELKISNTSYGDFSWAPYGECAIGQQEDNCYYYRLFSSQGYVDSVILEDFNYLIYG